MANKESKKFVRKHPMPGVYGTVWKKRQIQIKDREIFITDDKGLIEFFDNDPEIMEFVIDKEITLGKKYKDMTENELLKICKGKGLADQGVTIKDTTKKELIKILKEDEEENSKIENDQGEFND